MCLARRLHGAIHTVLVVLAVRLQSQSHPRPRLACCVIKMRENSLSGSANLFKGVNVIDIHSESGLEIFAGSSYRGSICPTGAKIGSSYREFRNIEGSRNRG